VPQPDRLAEHIITFLLLLISPAVPLRCILGCHGTVVILYVGFPLRPNQPVVARGSSWVCRSTRSSRRRFAGLLPPAVVKPTPFLYNPCWSSDTMAIGPCVSSALKCQISRSDSM